MNILLTSILLLFLTEPSNYPYHPIELQNAVQLKGRVIDADTQKILSGASVSIVEHNLLTTTDLKGNFEFTLRPGRYTLSVSLIGYQTHKQKIEVSEKGRSELIIKLKPDKEALQDVIIGAYQSELADQQSKRTAAMSYNGNVQSYSSPAYLAQPFNTEQYDVINENIFKWVRKTPLSTFSIDVDAASYSNVRRMILDGRLPVPDAVRIEEMINYFSYNYQAPDDRHPFSVHTEVAAAPWKPEHKLIQIGIQGDKIHAENLPPSNLVFLLDVSGSMSSPNKLPLLKKGFKLLVNQLNEDDYVSIVVYAGSSGLVLPPTSGAEKETILEALNNLRAGGSTAGAQGIKLAYETAAKHFRAEGNNRVILATDGDFNVGISSDGELVDLIEEYRNQGIFLSVLGFGSGNLKDSKMEKIADNGNGNYYYIDNLLEAKKVLVNEMGGTLHTIAKDVKIQVEFNPQTVQAYRLIGYENRLLNDQDFNDDTKDAGELGAGHTVTALYEIIPVGVEADTNLTDVDPLKYQRPDTLVNNFSDELMTVKLRYKLPDGDSSILLSEVIRNPQEIQPMSEDLSFAASVASFGMLLRNSKFKANSSFGLVKELALSGKGEDKHGYRSEFIKLVELAELLYEDESRK